MKLNQVFINDPCFNAGNKRIHFPFIQPAFFASWRISAFTEATVWRTGRRSFSLRKGTAFVAMLLWRSKAYGLQVFVVPA